MKAPNLDLKEIRDKMGWTQEDMARAVGVSLSTVHRWEHNGNQPSRLARQSLERALKKARPSGEGQV